jgi:uncharacterized protein DUF5670
VYHRRRDATAGWRRVLNLGDGLGAAYWTLVHLGARLRRVTIASDRSWLESHIRKGERGRGPTQASRMAWVPTSFENVEKEIGMFLIMALILAVAWVLGWAAFHIAGGLIHLLLIVAVVSLIVHFVRRGAARIKSA